MNFRMVAWWLCGAMVLGGCECGKGVTTEQDPPDASVEDAGLMLDAGQLVAQGVLSTANGDLILVRLDGGWSPFVERSSLGDAGHLRNARWQPNGTAVAFADGERAWKMFAGLTMVVELDADAGLYRGGSTAVEWAPDGGQLAIGGRDPMSQKAVFLVPADGGLPEFIARADAWGWSFDGSAIFSSYFDGDRGVHVLQRTELATRVTTELREARFLAAGPEGQLYVQREVDDGDGGTALSLDVLETDGGVRALFPSGWPIVTSDPLDGVVASPWSNEVVVRGRSRDAGTVFFEVLRGSGDGGAFTTMYQRDMPEPDFPSCFRFVPGGELSYQDSSRHFVTGRDGGVTDLAIPNLGMPLVLGCADWRVVRE